MFLFHIVSKSTHSSMVGQPDVTLPSPEYAWYTSCASDESDLGAVHVESEVDSEIGVDSGSGVQPELEVEVAL
jgi:hypothetical protein